MIPQQSLLHSKVLGPGKGQDQNWSLDFGSHQVVILPTGWQRCRGGSELIGERANSVRRSDRNGACRSGKARRRFTARIAAVTFRLSTLDDGKQTV